MSDRAWAAIAAAVGLLCLLILIADLRRGSTRIAGTSFSREHYPFAYWGMILVTAMGAVMGLSAAAELWAR